MMNWINKKRNKKGFTLVELVVVIAILGILAGIAVPKLSKSRENAAIAAHNANVRTLESAATLAVSEGKLNFGTGGATNVEWKEDNKAGGADGVNAWEDYLQSWPSIPTGLKGNEYIFVDATGDEASSKKDFPSTPYVVTITQNGTISVSPEKIKE